MPNLRYCRLVLALAPTGVSPNRIYTAIPDAAGICYECCLAAAGWADIWSRQQHFQNDSLQAGFHSEKGMVTRSYACIVPAGVILILMGVFKLGDWSSLFRIRLWQDLQVECCTGHPNWADRPTSQDFWDWNLTWTEHARLRRWKNSQRVPVHRHDRQSICRRWALTGIHATWQSWLLRPKINAQNPNPVPALITRHCTFTNCLVCERLIWRSIQSWKSVWDIE